MFFRENFPTYGKIFQDIQYLVFPNAIAPISPFCKINTALDKGGNKAKLFAPGTGFAVARTMGRLLSRCRIDGACPLATGDVSAIGTTHLVRMFDDELVKLLATGRADVL